MNAANSFDNLPQAVWLLHQKLELIAAKIDTISTQNDSSEKNLIGVDEASKLLGISKGALYSKVCRGRAPVYQTTCFWKPSDSRTRNSSGVKRPSPLCGLIVW